MRTKHQSSLAQAAPIRDSLPRCLQSIVAGLSGLALASMAFGQTHAASPADSTGSLPEHAPDIALTARAARPATASPNAAFAEILHRVEAATRPPADYSATVHQTVTKANVDAAPGQARAEHTLLAEEDYTVRGTRSGAIRARTQLASRRAPAAQPVTDQFGRRQLRGGLMTANPLNALLHVATMSAITVADESSQGEPCDKVTGTDPHCQIVLWISKTESTVRRLTVQRDTTLLYDTTLQYQRWNGNLVPAHVEITRPANGITMTQDFSGHSL
jgi:hypothetical protein